MRALLRTTTTALSAGLVVVPLLLVPLAAGAQVAPSWLEPVTLSASGGNVFDQKVAVDTRGNAIAVWRRKSGVAFAVQAAERPAGGAWQAPHDVSAPGQLAASAPQVAFDARGNAIAVWTRYSDVGQTVQASIKVAGRGWQAPSDLSVAGVDAQQPRVAVDRRGNAVVLWSGRRGTSYVVQAARRAAGGTWQAPQSLSASDGDASSQELAVSQNGTAVAVWRQQRGSAVVIQAAVRPAGSAWRPPQDLSESGGTPFSPRVAVDSRGNAIVVWAAVFPGVYAIHATSRRVGGAWQAPRELLVSGGKLDGPQVAVDTRGNAVAVWAHQSGATFFVQSIARPASSGIWQRPENLTAPNEDASSPQVAFDPAGDAIAVWSRTNDVIQASVRPVGGAWLAPRDVSGQGSIFPQVAVGPHGNALAVWRHVGGASVEAAGYDAAGPQLRGLRIPAKGKRGARLSFSVSPLDVWSGVGTTNWRFGDGGKANGAKASHVYRRAGRFTVTVTSEDGLGHTTTVTRVVRVR